ncbi:hypothetical protein HK101_003570 [Irineochytrium annulatum]|nr:hypothetical protein HK101_003570 [Irineochytrium annulatum]
MDPSARHLIISTESGDSYYLYKKWKKPKHLTKFRGVLIESIAWGRPRNSNDFSTGTLLIGSKQGHIFEAELQPTEDFFKKEEKYFKQVHSIVEDDMPITGIFYEAFPGSTRRYIVLVTTPDRLYQFIGNCSENSSEAGMFGDLFRNYDSNAGFQEIPRGDLTSSELRVWSPYQEDGYPSKPTKFAWLTGSGIYTGALSFGSQGVGDTIIESAVLLPYPMSVTSPDSAAEIPTFIALSEFHFILLFKDRVKAVCELNSELVYEEEIPLYPKSHGEFVIGMTTDVLKGTLWVFTNMVLYELLITEEDRDVWKLYLKKSNFDSAMTYAKTEADRDVIVTTQAEFYFNQKRYQLSANYFAQSLSLSFEEVALRFLEQNETLALKQFLLKKLERLKRSLNTLQDNLSSLEATEGSTEKKVSAEEYQLLKDEFYLFLKNYKDRLDISISYNIFESHGRIEELLYFAEAIGDFERVVVHWTTEKKWVKALEFINKQFSSVLIEGAPSETVNLWMKETKLDPRNLLPALLKYELSSPVGQNHAIRYLNYVINKLGNVDPAVHNYLLSLYVSQATHDNERGLLDFIYSQKERPCYDLQYALRICSNQGLKQSCISIYSLMGLYEQAVSLALKHQDLELAQINADKPVDDDMLRKKLWLLIAKHVIDERRDIKQAISFLKNCELLKIEDFLPCFPDFVLIDDFKDELCAALEDYNSHIDNLKSEMDEATKSAESIRHDIRELKNRYSVIPSTEKCFICTNPLMTRQFYIFPCQHVFHHDCLMSEVVKSVHSAKGKRILDLNEKIQRLSLSEKAAGSKARQGAKSESLLEFKVFVRQSILFGPN